MNEIESSSIWRRQLRPSRVHMILAIAGIALGLAVVNGVAKRAAARSEAASRKRHGIQRAWMSDEITLRAAGRGNPWINLSDGHELITAYSGPTELTQVLERNEARPLSLCSADFDEDGVPDLISGYAGGDSGIITLLRGNVDSIYPNAPEAQQRKAEGTFTEVPFISPALVFGVPQAADFIGAGDFDGDGHWDVVAAARGSNKIWLLSGDGRGGLRPTKEIDLPGGVTAMVVGEINRRDGLDDVVVGVSGEQGSKVLVFEGPEGALRATPETFDLPAEVTSVALGQLDDQYEMDLAVAAGTELLIIHGRDRRLSLDATRQAEVNQAEISTRTLPSNIMSIAVGDFNDNGKGIAVLLADGSIHLVAPANSDFDSSGKGKSLPEWREETLSVSTRVGPGQLVSVRISNNPLDSLLVAESRSRYLHVIAGAPVQASDAEASWGASTSISIEADTSPVAVLPMRLNEDALSDLVILGSSHSSLSIAETRPQAAFVVVNTNDGGAGSLRQAITDANNSAGADTISFNIAGAGTKTINLQSALPLVTDAVTIDGATQPGFAGTPLIVLQRTGQGSTLQLSAGNSVVRGLDICTAPSSAQAVVRDIEIITAGGNRIEGNVISESGVTIRTGNNVVGGTGSGASNKFAYNLGSSNVVISGSSAGGNQIQGNSFTALPNSCVSVLCGEAIRVSGPNNTIGGMSIQARNTIFGGRFNPQVRNPGADILIGGAPGTLVQGNYIGVDASGSNASGSATGIAVDFGPSVTIGGTTAQARNIISGHESEGISILGDGVRDSLNLVQGNYIGTDATGTIALSNTWGVVLALAKKTTIGGDTPGARNLISGNTSAGIQIVQAVGRLGCNFFGIPNPNPSVDFPVIGNFIGTDATGTQPLGNGAGIEVDSNAFSHEVRGNRIAFNTYRGVVIPEPTDPSFGLPAFSIKILDNSIYSNSVLGIDLAADGVTQNDLRDVDGGANLRQNFPLLLSSTFSSAPSNGKISPAARLSVSGTFNSTPNSTFTLQFFFGSGCDASGHQFIGAIPIPLGSLPVTTDANGNASYTFSFDFPTGTSSGFINSTATDANGNTSETSACLEVANPLRIVSACKGEGKQLIINGSGFVEGAKVFLNGGQEKTSFISSTQVIAKKAGKRAVTGDMLKVHNPDGSETALLTYTRVNCSP